MRHKMSLAGAAGTIVSLSLFLLPASSAHAQLDQLDAVIGGTSAAAQGVSAPMPVDLLVDADSYVPPFYQGRALPSAGTDLRLEALARFTRPDGTLVPSADIVYTWHQDDRVVGNVSGLGQSSVVLPSPPLYGSTDIEVDAQTQDNTLEGTASIVLPSTQPVLLLYEDNPLLGLTFYHALGGETELSDVEMTFAAVPYFAEIQSPNDPRLAYAWTVNGSSVSSSAADPSEVTLNSANSNGLATVGLTLSHATNFLMSSTGSWDIALGAGGSSGFGGPTSGTKDPFTGQN